jgi:hypothetical protein
MQLVLSASGMNSAQSCVYHHLLSLPQWLSFAEHRLSYGGDHSLVSGLPD